MATFNARSLTDIQLVLLEATLRVEINLHKCSRAAQVTAGVGLSVVTGGIAAIPISIGIVMGMKKRKVYKQYWNECVDELRRRGLQPSPINEKIQGKRAFTKSLGKGAAVCVVGIGNLAIHEAVLQIVSAYVLTGKEEDMTRDLEQEDSPSPVRPHEPMDIFCRDKGGKGVKGPIKFVYTKAKQFVQERRNSEPASPPSTERRSSEPQPASSNQAPTDVYVCRTDAYPMYGECYYVTYSTDSIAGQTKPLYRQDYGGVTFVGDEPVPSRVIDAVYDETVPNEVRGDNHIEPSQSKPSHAQPAQ
ncbi:hypothetical protein Poli38472_001855 [Pythium oligandrum]|uniref:Uncharacterized protein n=1 Tax=Pythium oligandrum TaxID=41045 RepID=A0A8K1CUD1_PYTOL|nr:hypothetical protein Poli38472_001855 [Pythium oligandrum]|eukprot:TMW69699.1 hypothetical protein Poli38472_001855 [Pythium oligandrum]